MTAYSRQHMQLGCRRRQRVGDLRSGLQGLTAGILIEAAKLVLGQATEFEDTVPGAPPYSHIWFDGTRVAVRR